MRPIWKTVAVLSLLTIGYVLGASSAFSPKSLRAQAAAEGGPSADSLKKLQEALAAVKAAAETLEQESLYVPATSHLNVFAVTAGGINAVQDLEDGRGVDPETFASLYAGDAKPEIKEHLDFDEQGRLTYKGKVVRIFSKQRMKKVFQDRIRFGAGTSKKS